MLVPSWCSKRNGNAKPTIIVIGVVLAAAVLIWLMLSVSDGGGDLEIEDIVVGTGKVAAPGDIVVVHYTGKLLSGKKFDSSVDRGEPFKFQLGAQKVIKGWDRGVKGMKEGGKRKLTIPPDLAYGAKGAPPDIPPNSTLVFDIELLKVE